MTNPEREQRRRQYFTLGTGELAAALFFPWALNTFLRPRTGLADDATCLWFALAPLLIILAQAGTYWLGARTWVKSHPMPRPWAVAYRTFRLINPLFLIAGFIGMIYTWPPTIGAGLICLGFWLFAVIEYVNYFIVRLSYPFSRWFRDVTQWRTPQLIRDINGALRPEMIQPHPKHTTTD